MHLTVADMATHYLLEGSKVIIHSIIILSNNIIHYMQVGGLLRCGSAKASII